MLGGGFGSFVVGSVGSWWVQKVCTRRDAREGVEQVDDEEEYSR
jgi:hypothetical protein